MDAFKAHFVPFLNEVAIAATLHMLISLLLEDENLLSFDLIFDPIFTRPRMSSFQVMAYIIYASSFYSIFLFLKAFSKLPMVEAVDYQLAALFWYPVTILELTVNHMDDDWEYIAPLYATIHHIYMVLVCCFISLSMACGFMIHNHLPTLKVSYLQYLRSAWEFVEAIKSGTFTTIKFIYIAGGFLLERVLDSLLVDSPFWLIVTPVGLVLGDILLAIWTANILVPARLMAQLNMTESWSILSERRRYGSVLTWLLEDSSVPGWKSVDLIQSSVQSYSARFAQWYSNQHERDEIHHYPALTATVMFLVACLGVKWLWEEKPQRLRQIENIVEETIWKNAIIADFEDYLRKRSNRTDDCKAFMSTNLEVIRDTVARNKTLNTQNDIYRAQTERLQDNLTERAQQMDRYLRETIDLRGQNRNLQTEVERLQASADVQTHVANMEALNAQLASVNEENGRIQRQREQLNRELSVVRESRKAVEARAIAAEKERTLAISERVALRADLERLERQNAELQMNLQELSGQKGILEREIIAAQAVANTAAELMSRNSAMKTHIQSLQATLNMQEAHSAETSRASQETVRALQTEIEILRRQHDARTREPESPLHREEQTRTPLRMREARMRDGRDTRRAGLKKTSELHSQLHDTKNKLQDTELSRDCLKEDVRSLEKRVVQLNPSLEGSTQTIHDPHKDEEVRKYRDQAERSQAQNILLKVEMETLKETIDRLEKQLAAKSAMSPAQQSPSAMRAARADSDELIRARSENTRLEQEVRSLQIKISNLEMQRSGSRSGNPLRGPSRGSRGSRRP